MRRPNHATVVAYIALFVALGGTATAASKVLIKSTKQIKNEAVTSADVANGSLTGGDVKDHSIGAVDLAPTVLTAGPKGDKGDKGDPGPSATFQARLPYTGGVGIAFPAGPTTLHTLALPAGSYVAEADVTFKAGAGSANGPVCDLIAGSTTARFVEYAAGADFGNMSQTLAFSSPTPVTLALSCQPDLGTPIARYASALTATQVGSVTLP